MSIIQTISPATASTVTLSAGTHIMRVSFYSNCTTNYVLNLNCIKIRLFDATTPSAPQFVRPCVVNSPVTTLTCTSHTFLCNQSANSTSYLLNVLYVTTNSLATTPSPASPPPAITSARPPETATSRTCTPTTALPRAPSPATCTSSCPRLSQQTSLPSPIPASPPLSLS